MAGIAVTSWCKGTECRLAPDGEESRGEGRRRPLCAGGGGGQNGGTESVWGYTERNRMIAFIPFLFSLIIYSVGSNLVIDLFVICLMKNANLCFTLPSLPW